MLKYFSSVIEESINTGGSKTLCDMQKTIKRFLVNEGIQHREIKFAGRARALNAVLNLAFPSPNTNYLLFGYIGLPFFETLLVIPYCFLFCWIAFKKRITGEKFFVIIIDLIEWQSALWVKRRGKKARFLRIFQCSLERILLSHVADEVISLIDTEFVRDKYKSKNIHTLEFIDYYSDSRPCSIDRGTDLRVLYAGDLSREFDTRLLGDVLENLSHSCKLLVAGFGLKKPCEKKLREFSNFDFYGQLNVNELNDLARKCQFGLIVYPPEYLYYNIASLGKLSFYIINGLTVISTNLKRIKELNAKYDFGYTLDREELLKLIKDLSPDKFRRNKELERRIITGHFLYAALTKLDFSQVSRTPQSVLE